MTTGGRIGLVSAVLAAGAFALACGSGDAVSSGHWEGTPGAPSGGANGDTSSGDISGAWPKADPDPTGGPHGGPTFGADDGGAPGGTTQSACTGKAGALGDSTLTMNSAGGLRDAIVHVPASYDPTKPTMLVLSYHGFGSNAPEQVILTRMNQSADAKNFIVVYPDGIASSWNAGACCGDAWTNSVDDVQFTKDLLAKLEGDYCVDTHRVYATGMSNGGFMSHRLGCEMSDVFAAVAPVAGVLGIDGSKCNPKRSVPVLDFHGTSDPIVPYRGGTPISPVDFGNGIPITFRSVDDTISIWRGKDACLSASQTIYSQGDAVCSQWTDCTGRGDDVVLCTIDGGGHTWPGGVAIPPLGKTSVDISATDTMVDFFLAHPLPDTATTN